MAQTGNRWPLAFATALGLGAVAAGFAVGGDRIEDWQLAARWTARVGLPVFLVTYLASSLARLFPSPGTKVLLRDRRWWGLGFASTHTIHLVALTTFLTIGPESRTLGSLVPGGLAYVVLYLMAATSNGWAMRRLGRNWKRLHTFGMHYIWFIYTAAYAGRIFEPGKQVEGAIATTLLVGALGMRLAARRKRAPVPAVA